MLPPALLRLCCFEGCALSASLWPLFARLRASLPLDIPSYVFGAFGLFAGRFLASLPALHTGRPLLRLRAASLLLPNEGRGGLFACSLRCSIPKEVRAALRACGAWLRLCCLCLLSPPALSPAFVLLWCALLPLSSAASSPPI